MLQEYDIIVVGAGHAGCEAAAASANLGSKTLLITMDMEKMAQMSCNPAMGGIAKGQIVREIDALGGYAGIITDMSSVQFRMLNRSKGPAMWSPRSQCDRMKYSKAWRDQLEQLENLDFWQGTVVELIIEDGVVKGVVTELGITFKGRSVILTNGTFLNGLIHVGRSQLRGGRMGERASLKITEQLAETGFKTDRMKTGTPVRIDGRSINFDKLVEQKGEEGFYTFSYLPGTQSKLKQNSCWITFTNDDVHTTLRSGFDESPLYNGTIQSIGPRYCPSIETKLMTFADKDQHHLFLEPEGETTIEYYLNGFSSSLPWEVQLASLKKVPGLEEVKIFRPGYAIEYDFFDPTQLYHTLETKLVKNLFFAGQINGTTGYEEAGAQGLMAGINAHQKLVEGDSFVLDRSEAYIGVLIDDLVTKGVDEPYRMFTSRAEYRILLRQDNADVRLTPKGYQMGIVTQERYDLLKEKEEWRDKLISFCKEYSVKPAQINEFLESKRSSPLRQGVKLVDVILRPGVSLFDIMKVIKKLHDFTQQIPQERRDEIIEAAEILIKYSGYIEREKLIADKLKRLEDINIEGKFDYHSIKTLSTEARQKLDTIQPRTIGQASRITGVSPSDINVLLVMLGR